MPVKEDLSISCKGTYSLCVCYNCRAGLSFTKGQINSNKLFLLFPIASIDPLEYKEENCDYFISDCTSFDSARCRQQARCFVMFGSERSLV